MLWLLVHEYLHDVSKLHSDKSRIGKNIAFDELCGWIGKNRLPEVIAIYRRAPLFTGQLSHILQGLAT